MAVRAVCVQTKIAALTMISLSFALLWGFVLEDWRLAVATGAALALVGTWIATRPGAVKEEDTARPPAGRGD